MAEVATSTTNSLLKSGIGNANPYIAITNSVTNAISSIINGTTAMFVEGHRTIQNEANKYYDYLNTQLFSEQQFNSKVQDSIDNSTSNSSTYVTYFIVVIIIAGLFGTMIYMKKTGKS